MTNNLYFSNPLKDKEAIQVHSGSYEDVDKAYGAGKDFSFKQYTSTLPPYMIPPYDLSSCNLYDKNGGLTSCRVLKGSKDRLNRIYRTNTRLRRDLRNDRYMEKLISYIGSTTKEIKCTSILRLLPEYGRHFWLDIQNIISNKESEYQGHKNYRYYDITSEKLPIYAYKKINDLVYLYSLDMFKSSILANLIWDHTRVKELL